MSVFKELLFLQGYITQSALPREEEQGPPPAPRASPLPAPRPRLSAVAAVPGDRAVVGCG